MIANCATLGLDYATTSLGEYAEALEAYNEVNGDPAKRDKPEPASDDFKRFMRGVFRASSA